MAEINYAQPTPAGSSEGGETFFQRQKRLQGQQVAQTNNPQATTNGQTQPLGQRTLPQRPPTPSDPSGGRGVVGPPRNPAATTNAQPATPVMGNGKIPDPTPQPAAQTNAQPAPQPGNPAAQTNANPGAPGNPAASTQPVGQPAQQQQQTAAPAAPAPIIDRNAMAQFTAQGVDFNRIQGDGTTPVPGHPGKFFNHNGFGWTIGEYQGGQQVAGDTPPTPPTPSPVAGWVPSKDGSGWVPPDHPHRWKPPTGSSAPGTPAAPNPAVLQPVDLGTGAQPTYEQTNFTQFEAPSNPDIERGQADLARAILANPESMSPEVVAMMKNAQKEEALLAAKQRQMMLNANAAARGVSGGGSEQAQTRRLNESTDSSILSNNRATDIEAARTNFGDRLNASGAVDSILNNILNRSTTAYDSRLRGEGMQADERFRGYSAERQNDQDALQRILAQFGINEAVAGNRLNLRDADRSDQALALQGELGRGGLAIDNRRLDSQNRQFSQNHALNISQFLEGIRTNNNNSAFNWAQLDQNGQQNLINQILAMVR